MWQCVGELGKVPPNSQLQLRHIKRRARGGKSFPALWQDCRMSSFSHCGITSPSFPSVFLCPPPALLICPPRPNESPISASQTPWPRRRLSAGRGFAWRWGPCRPYGCADPAGTSTRSCPSLWFLLTVSRPSRPLGRRGQSSSLWRRLAARSTRSHPGYPEHWREDTEVWAGQST